MKLSIAASQVIDKLNQSFLNRWFGYIDRSFDTKHKYKTQIQGVVK